MTGYCTKCRQYENDIDITNVSLWYEYEPKCYSCFSVLVLIEPIEVWLGTVTIVKLTVEEEAELYRKLGSAFKNMQTAPFIVDVAD